MEAAQLYMATDKTHDGRVQGRGNRIWCPYGRAINYN